MGDTWGGRNGGSLFGHLATASRGNDGFSRFDVALRRHRWRRDARQSRWMRWRRRRTRRSLERENARLKLEIAKYAAGKVEARGANEGAEALPKKSFSAGPRLQHREGIAHEVEDDVFVVWG